MVRCKIATLCALFIFTEMIQISRRLGNVMAASPHRTKVRGGFASLSRSLLIAAGVILGLLAPLSARSAELKSDKVSFYFAAHEDDWQLFMDPTAFEDVLGGGRQDSLCLCHGG